jgi:hypothetical protein
MKKRMFGLAVWVTLALAGVAYAYSGACRICDCPGYVGGPYNQCLRCSHSLAAH